MHIQWFPGHMTRAKRQIEDKLKLIDLAIELVDARLPLSSRNPMVDSLLRGKPRMVLLNKEDLADPAVTSEWVKHFRAKGLEAMPIRASGGAQAKAIEAKAKELLADKREAMIRRGIQPRPIRALIVGIPNVGKSTLINTLAGRAVAATGDKPGVTKGQQWIKTSIDMELLDTPGILWPKFDDQRVGFRLAVTGAIKDEIIAAEEVAFFALQYLARYYGDRLKERYGADLDVPEAPAEPEKAAGDEPEGRPEGSVTSIADPELHARFVELMEAIGRRRGCLEGGGQVSYAKTGMALLRDIRTGKLGRISWERPE
ncbi:ribosome biogenesis GTPase YlqF [Paenibacillus thermoaerophilus]|uniref:Ribosome biogenesis GTPase A n=1 Tax=Paenibacillus thermoaerophilus TaxID=1215385 RepID=A0ABW2V2F2_9BACL|nr:ribosome biogenesis GTPase YlqF [Paenibacillus thermoaerophilus]TMV19197.1 ribosome biogenesis GTPase YlqF [Paenibacillus thermoaerophilus]